MPPKLNLTALVSVVAVATAAVSAVAVAPALAASAPPARAELVGFVCQRAVDPPARKVAITATMRPINGTHRMALKFMLERRTPQQRRFVVLRGRGLDSWVYPNPPTLGQLPNDVWNLTHKVVNLAGPASYRFRVRFRWIGSGGRVLSQTARLSPVCYEPELRPNLIVRSITINQLNAQRDRYQAVIKNGGLSAAGGFAVELALAGAVPETLTVPSLAPHASTTVTFTAPACTSGSTVSMIADPNRQVDDGHRADNALTVPCTSSSGA